MCAGHFAPVVSLSHDDGPESCLSVFILKVKAKAEDVEDWPKVTQLAKAGFETSFSSCQGSMLARDMEATEMREILVMG